MGKTERAEEESKAHPPSLRYGATGGPRSKVDRGRGSMLWEASKLFFDMGLMGLNGVWAVQSLKSIRRRCAMARQEVRSRAALRAVRCLHVPAFAASHRGEAGACECRMQNGKVMFGYVRIFGKNVWVSQTCWLNSPSSYFSATRLRRGYGVGSKMANR